MKICSLVTGGAGFIGSHIAQNCLDMGHDVIVLDDLSGGDYNQVPKKARFVIGSICDSVLVSELFSYYKFDYVYHLAAYAAEGLSHFIRAFNYQNNVVGTMNLINESVKHEVKRFIFTSSIAVYGHNIPPFKETDIPEPEDPYGVAKYTVEMDLKIAQRMFGLDYTIFRPHNVYGPNQNLGDRYRNVVGIFMNQIMQNKPLSIYGNGLQRRSFTYISDIAPNIAKSVDMDITKNKIFNLGSSVVTTVNDLAIATSKAFNVELKTINFPARDEVVNAWADHSLAYSIFGEPKINLETGLSEMAKWAKETSIRPPSKIMIPEINKNLPEVWRCSQ